MNIDDRYCTSILADKKMYVDDADYRDFIVKRIQDDISKALITALCTKDAIVAIKGNSTTQIDEIPNQIICRQDIYIKNLVQCKDCKWYTQFKNKNGEYLPEGECEGIGFFKPEDFCSRGEKKEVE